MTTAFPGNADDPHSSEDPDRKDPRDSDPGDPRDSDPAPDNPDIVRPLDGSMDGPVTEEEISRRFAAIVSGIASDMHWDTTGSELPASAGAAQLYLPGGDEDPADTAEQRRLRRERRRAERAEEVAAFAAEQANRRAEHEADDEHFVPGEPPPLPVPRLRTVLAVLLIASGIFLLVGPNFLTISPDGLMVFSLGLMVVGAGLLVTGMRRMNGDDGWDDGSRV